MIPNDLVFLFELGKKYLKTKNIGLDVVDLKTNLYRVIAVATKSLTEKNITSESRAGLEPIQRLENKRILFDGTIAITKHDLTLLNKGEIYIAVQSQIEFFKRGEYPEISGLEFLIMGELKEIEEKNKRIEAISRGYDEIKQQLNKSYYLLNRTRTQMPENERVVY